MYKSTICIHCDYGDHYQSSYSGKCCWMWCSLLGKRVRTDSTCLFYHNTEQQWLEDIEYLQKYINN